MKCYVVSAIVTELKMKFTWPSFSPIREMFFSKLEPKIPFLQLQSHKALLSHLINSSDYIIKIQLISIISSCFELRDKVVSGIINPTDGWK